MKMPRTLASLLTVTMVIGLTGCSVYSNNDTGQPGHGRGKADSFGAFTGDTRTSSKESVLDTSGLAHQKPTDPSIPATVSLRALQQSNTYYNLSMATGEVGYRWGYVNGQLAMERTEDQGKSWYSLTLPLALRLDQMKAGTGALENPNVQVVDPDSVYVFAVIGSRLLSLHTADAGHDWTQTSLPLATGGLQLASVSLLGDQDGWMLLRGQGKQSGIHELYHLQDHATKATLLHVRPNAKDAGLPSGAQAVVSFTNPQKGWLVAATTASAVQLYMTNDAGRTWSSKTLPAPQELTGWKAVLVYQPAILEQEGSFLVRYARQTGAKMQYQVAGFRSINGGLQFKSRVEDQLQDAMASYTGDPAYFLNPDYGWAINDQRLVATWDGGMTWRTIHSSSFEPILHAYPRILGIDFVSDTVGYCLLQSADYKKTAFVHLTENGTTTWLQAEIVSH
ncbi:hypothetical protein NZD89_22220 [Alicyclobacillus fastidiosus]|uniref:Photosynthesis system II assembly factor Ycf48/Hcf136-like domain-containing protein n=1 Tax=Alicyclobacillus fastidiosus TaxID=392011 RepID=A0ABY6ZE20_9BACL|nr:hypothetical protein [Alicyclobacillus fastidiosus]WAH40975.1 hypothetical protein NZD89_22220 [Alicyclobacillus fastidiosus]GMA62489.1 hypothetical protein GCM10025859_29290 [Alicyclobacillus fastidiosus]